MTRIAALAIVLAALALAGCGGDEESGSPPYTGVQSQESAATGDGGTATSDSDTSDAAQSEPAPTDARPEEPDSREPDAPSREEYIARADPICRKAQAEIGVQGREIQKVLKALAQRKIDQPEYYRRTGTLTKKSADIARLAVAELERLPRPAERRQALEAYLGGAAEQARLLGAQADEQRRGDVKGVVKLNRRLSRLGAKTSAAARRFGFHTCGGG